MKTTFSRLIHILWIVMLLLSAANCRCQNFDDLGGEKEHKEQPKGTPKLALQVINSPTNNNLFFRFEIINNGDGVADLQNYYLNIHNKDMYFFLVNSQQQKLIDGRVEGRVSDFTHDHITLAPNERVGLTCDCITKKKTGLTQTTINCQLLDEQKSIIDEKDILLQNNRIVNFTPIKIDSVIYAGNQLEISTDITSQLLNQSQTTKWLLLYDNASNIAHMHQITTGEIKFKNDKASICLQNALAEQLVKDINNNNNNNNCLEIKIINNGDNSLLAQGDKTVTVDKKGKVEITIPNEEFEFTKTNNGKLKLELKNIKFKNPDNVDYDNLEYTFYVLDNNNNEIEKITTVQPLSKTLSKNQTLNVDLEISENDFINKILSNDNCKIKINVMRDGYLIGAATEELKIAINPVYGETNAKLTINIDENNKIELQETKTQGTYNLAPIPMVIKNVGDKRPIYLRNTYFEVRFFYKPFTGDIFTYTSGKTAEEFLYPFKKETNITSLLLMPQEEKTIYLHQESDPHKYVAINMNGLTDDKLVKDFFANKEDLHRGKSEIWLSVVLCARHNNNDEFTIGSVEKLLQSDFIKIAKN